MSLTSEANTVSAQSFDRLPAWPRFLRELVLIPYDNGFIIDGTHELHAFSGDAVRHLLTTLIPLMDGHHTVEEIAVALSFISATQVRAAISVLYEWGMIEDGTLDLEERPTAASAESLGFFRRYASATRVNSSGKEACEKLSASEVVILQPKGSSHHAEVLTGLLQKSGVRWISQFTRDTWDTWQRRVDLSTTQTIVISMSFAGEDLGWHEECDDWCFQNKLPWLRTVIDTSGDYADIGPIFTNERACYRCFREVHSRLSTSQKLTDTKICAADEHFWLSMIAIEIVYRLSGVGPSLTERGFQRYQLRDWASQHLRCTRIPGCVRCRPNKVETAQTEINTRRSPHIDTAIVFEDYVGLQSRAMFSVQRREGYSNVHRDSAPMSKCLPNCKQYALSRTLPRLDRGVFDTLRSNIVDSNPTLTVDQLAAILLVTAGFRQSGIDNDNVQRWTATAGNLGSVEIFVAVRQVSGLGSGIYFYQPHEHSLARFQRRGGAIAAEDLVRRLVPNSPPHLPDVLIFFTGAYHRLSKKYGAFAYRLINLDAGVAMSQLHLVARSLNLWSQTLCNWSGELIEEQTNLEPLAEQVTAVAALSRRNYTETDYSNSVYAGKGPRPNQTHSGKEARQFFELPVNRVVEMLVHESRLTEYESHFDQFGPSGEPLPSPPETMPEMVLPSPNLVGRSVSKILTERTSVRNFATAPVSIEGLSNMLACAHHADATSWPAELHQGHPLTFWILAWRVNGLPPGVYRYAHEAHALHLFSSAPSPNESNELFIQSEFASSPLVVWIAGNLAAACACHGAAGHRYLLLRAGAAAQRLWTAALGVGLTGAITAGLVPGAAQTILNFDGYKQASLVAFATGHGIK